MQVNCPKCATHYLLPDSLLGPGGARVKCPRCREPFVVEPPAVIEAAEPLVAASPGNGSESNPEAAPAAEATPATATEPQTAEEVARAILSELAAHSGEAIVASREQGRLFRDFGPVIVEAFEFYRRSVGPGASPAPFRAALREQWGVQLDVDALVPRSGANHS